MRSTLSLLLVAALMIAVLAIPSAMAQAPGGGTMAKPGAAKTPGDEHPAIRKALVKLQEAHEILRQHAENDFEGHKNKALKSIDEAMEQLKIAEGMKQ